jgi:hypothetical protein
MGLPIGINQILLDILFYFLLAGALIARHDVEAREPGLHKASFNITMLSFYIRSNPHM